MTPTHCIFNLKDGKLAARVFEMPERQNFVYNKSYNDAIQYAIANGVDFKDEKDIEKLKFYIWDDDEQVPWPVEFDIWQPESMKPYKIPEGLEIRFDCYCNLKVECTCQDMSVCHSKTQFAFMNQPKEQKCRLCDKYVENKSRIICDECYDRILGKEKPEDQEELFQEAIKLWLHSEKIETVTSKFTIQRK